MLLCSHPEKASERHHGVRDATAYLLDHQTLDASDVITSWVIDRRTFHPVALDQGLARHFCSSCLCHGILHNSLSIQPANTTKVPKQRLTPPRITRATSWLEEDF